MAKIATDIEQSKKLAEILPVDSADMHYNNISIKGINYADEYRAELMEYNRAIKVLSNYAINLLLEVIPCWSLVALLEVIGVECRMEKTPLDQSGEFTYSMVDDYNNIRTFECDNPIDTCYEMILKLHELKLL